ncbi:MAG: hypothetical protein ACSHX8_13870, partial [Opitutaceae bacterium]
AETSSSFRYALDTNEGCSGSAKRFRHSGCGSVGLGGLFDGPKRVPRSATLWIRMRGVAEARSAFGKSMLDTHVIKIYVFGMAFDSAENTSRHKQRLKRLSPTFYQGKAYVHWTFGIDGRKTGWLSEVGHQRLRGILFQTLVRYHQVCPAYCLMPDHAHFLIVGLNDRADQKSWARALTREWNPLLTPYELARQQFDHVLREDDRKHDAFADLVGYILRNPVRKGLINSWSEWSYSGGVVPGYPGLDPRKPYFWENFWSAYQEQAD